MSLFLNDTFHDYENRLLPTNIFVLTNIGEGREGHGEVLELGGGEDQHGSLSHDGGTIQLELEFTSTHIESNFDILHIHGKLKEINFIVQPELSQNSF